MKKYIFDCAFKNIFTFCVTKISRCLDSQLQVLEFTLLARTSPMCMKQRIERERIG
jgi:hypothetical protein